MPFDSKKTWDACGEAFDRFTTATDSYSDNVERPAIEQLIEDVSDSRTLDLGCGSGAYSVWLAEMGAEVVGLDLSARMISLAQDKAREQASRLDFCVADINAPLPFADAGFDLVVTATALHYVEDLGMVMREVARVMKPRARFIASLLHPMSTARFPITENVTDRSWESRREWEASYFGPTRRAIETPWLGFGPVSDGGRMIFCYHHTTSDYFAAIQAAG